MDALPQALNRQAAWQRSRSKLPWAEKLRQAVAMRESLRGFAKAAPAASRAGGEDAKHGLHAMGWREPTQS